MTQVTTISMVELTEMSKNMFESIVKADADMGMHADCRGCA